MVHMDGESLGTVIATAVVDASVEECVAYQIVGLDSREKKKNMNKRGVEEIIVQKTMTTHSTTSTLEILVSSSITVTGDVK